MSDFSMEGRVALITGGTSGIGLGIAAALAEAGARVVLCGRSAARGEAAAGKLVAKGHDAVFRALDVASPPDIEKVVDSVAASHGRLDAMVASAGGLMVKPALEVSAGDMDALLSVHIRGGFLCAQAAARAMMKAGGGKILFVTSLLAERAVPNQAAYIAAKGGVVAMARALAIEWGPHNIQVNCLGPQLTRTPLTEGLYTDPQKLKSVMERTPAGRAGEVGDVTGAAVFLCSPASDFLTGQHIIVDGGRAAGA